MDKRAYFSKLAVFRYASDAAIIFTAFFYSLLAANLLGPEKYGLITYVMAFVVGLPMLFGFEAFYDLVKIFTARYRSKKVVVSALFFASFFLLVLGAIVIIFSEQVIQFLGKGTTELIWITAVLLFFVPVASLLQSVLAGTKQFGKLLKLTLLEKFLDVFFLLVFFFVFNSGYLSILFGRILSIAIVCFSSAMFLRKIKFLENTVSKKEVIDYSSQAVLSNIAKGIYVQADVWIYGAILSLPLLGVFYLLKRLASYFFETPQIALSEVLFPFLSEEKDKRILVDYSTKAIKFQVLLNLGLAVAFAVTVPVFLFVFFPAYSSGASVAPFIAFGFLFNFSSPIMKLLKSINKNMFLTGVYVLTTLILLVSGFLLIPSLGLIGAALSILVSRFSCTALLLAGCHYYGYKVGFIPNLTDVKYFASFVMVPVKNYLSKTFR